MIRWIIAIGLLMLVAVGTAVGLRAYEVNAAYVAAVASIDRLRDLAPADPTAISPGALSDAQRALDDLQFQMERIDRATSLPGGEPVVASLPWVGPRYASARGLVQLGLVGVDAGDNMLAVGSDLLPSLSSGALTRSAAGGPTWLDALTDHEQQLATVTADLQRMRTLRVRIDTSVLPDRIGNRLAQLDQLLDRPELDALSTVDIDALADGLGRSDAATYLVAFQNPAELRPTGGFPGTMALVTLRRGQPAEYHFFDSHELTDDYLAHRQQALSQPWPIDRFFPQPDGFLLHDALWWPDFPHSAQQFMRMYAESGWPAIDGVIAVQPEVASALVDVTGPFTVEFAGQRRLINADNIYSEIDRQRVQDVQTHDDVLVHKEMLGLIGQNLIERLKKADARSLGTVLKQFGAACERRDLQIYSSNPRVEAQLDRYNCTGRLEPVTGVPTLAVTYANMVLSKTSLDMRPRLSLSLDAPHDRMREGHLDIDVRDGAVADEDPFYAGFQRWWVAVALPTGSALLSDPGPMEDPQAPNGGSYMAAIFPDQTGHISVRFSMPDAASLVVRRQPGVRPGDVSVSVAGCAGSFSSELDHDLVVDLAGLCSASTPR